MASPGLNALNFLITTIFDIYILIIAVRFLMQLTRADYHNPLSQFIVKVSNPLLIPLRKFVPGFAGTDIAALVLCFLLVFAKLTIFKAIGFVDHIGGQGLNLAAANWLQIALLSIVSVVELFFNLFIYALVAQALLSWISTGGNNPAFGVLQSITSPVLTPLRRIIPPMGGMDLSALAGIIGLSFLKILTIQSLVQIVT